MQPQVNDIFTFDPEFIYQIVLIGGFTIEGKVIDARDDGIVMEDLKHIPTDKILFFTPILSS